MRAICRQYRQRTFYRMLCSMKLALTKVIQEDLRRDDPSEEGEFRMPCVSRHGREWPVRVTWNCIRT